MIGIVYPLAIGVAGMLLIFLLDGLGFDSVQLAYATLLVIVLWLFVGLRLGRAYPARLRKALQERSFSGLAAPRPDQSSVSVLEEALASTHPGAVLYALDMLEEIAPQKLSERLPDMLAYPDQAVQIAALERIANLPGEETPPGVPALLEASPDPRVRSAALRTWYAIDPAAATTVLEDLSQDSHAEVQQAALAIMSQHEDTAVRDRAVKRLQEMAAAEDMQVRIAAARVLGETADPARAGDLASHCTVTFTE